MMSTVRAILMFAGALLALIFGAIVIATLFLEMVAMYGFLWASVVVFIIGIILVILSIYLPGD